MKKALVITTLAAMIVSGGFIYNAYANESSVVEQPQETQVAGENSTVGQSQETQVASESEVKEELVLPATETQPKGTISISEVEADEIFIPESILDVSVKAKGASTVLKEGDISARITEVGLQLLTTYTTQDNHEIVFTQVPATLSEEDTITSLKNSYKLEEVQITTINGHTAVYVDGEYRRVVHLITEEHFFTSSTATGTLDDLFNVINQIKE